MSGASVDVWFGMRPRCALPPSFEESLSPAESARAARFATGELRANYVFAHGFLRCVLARYLLCNPAGVEILEGERGKPHLRGGTPWFNLSHSGATAAVAVTLAGPVGIDVEEIRVVPERDRIAAQYFPPGEEGTFFERWTRLEALAKATGRGLAEAALEPRWWVENLAAPEGFAAAVSAEHGPLAVRYQKLYRSVRLP
jgi:4'-phosphopantetheinyl transferase